MKMLTHFALTALLGALSASAEDTLTNDAWKAKLRKDGTVRITAKAGPSRIFRPVFTVLHRGSDPGMKYSLFTDLNYRIPNWSDASGSAPDQRTWNYFEAGAPVTLTATNAASSNGRIEWTFPGRPEFKLYASLALPAGGGEPLITFELNAQEDGYFSVGYTGAPDLPPDRCESIWQPMVWQERRFPSAPMLSTEATCSLPATMLSADGVTAAVIADPDEIPFRLPTLTNARFGVMIRNAAGNAQPMLFAPVLGLSESKLAAGKSFRFRMRLSVRNGDWFESFRHLSQTLYRFRDCRENALCSLNETIENMLGFAMHGKYNGWDAEAKAFDYATDVKDTVKLVSALHPLSLAIVTDDEEIFRERARPMIEYLLSREKFMYAKREGIKHQNPSHRMAGPAGEAYEWASLYVMSQKRTGIFRHAAQARHDHPRALNLDTVHRDAGWVDDLALYQVTGMARDLDSAKARAGEYVARRIDTPQSDFSASNLPGSGQFWTDFAPRWMQLLQLYEQTRDKRFLDAAANGARAYAACCWMSPPIPDASVTVNHGGKVPMFARLADRDSHFEIGPEEDVPAWWVSNVGLTPEAANTYHENPAVFLTMYAPAMLRLSQYTGDDYFRVLARNAVVGRYSNYPGYDINWVFTTLCMKPDYPTRPGDPYRRYNQFYLNHVWPHIAMLTDFLFSDAKVRSEGRIEFPSEYAQGYVYLQCDVYGGRPGRFYEDANVLPYLPKGLLKADNMQVNHVAGRGNGQLYLALMNQSAKPLITTVTLDPAKAGIQPGQSYKARVWTDNRPSAPITITGGKFTLPVSAAGITAVAIEGVNIKPSFQDRILGPSRGSDSPSSHAVAEWPAGKIHGMILDFGRGLASGYVWLTANERDLSAATLHYRSPDGSWRKLTDSTYPYEFSFPLGDEARSVEFRVEGVAGGGVVRSAAIKLTR